VYWYTRLNVETIVVQVVYSFLLAALIFIFLRLLARLSLTRAFLRTLAGGISLAGFPLFALWCPMCFFYYHEPHIEAHSFWLFLELAIILICTVLYYLRRWPIPAWVSIFLLSLHFSIWGWVTGCYLNPFSEVHYYSFGGLAFWFDSMFCFGFPVLGFLSSLTWGMYVRLSTESAQVAKAPKAS
jgi:hypothetical protein